MAKPALPPFNAVAMCPKCHGDDIGAFWCERRRAGWACAKVLDWDDVREHLHRTCRRCHYEWIEATRDSEEP